MKAIEAWLLARLASPDERFNRAEWAVREAPRGLLALALGLLVVGLLVHALGLRRRARAPGRGRLIFLRALAALALAWLVVGPALELQRAVRIPSRVAILLDTSASMALADGEATRLERGREAVRALAAALAGRRDVELYAFDGELRPLAPADLGAAGATGRRTDLAAALAALAAADAERNLEAVFVVSDGADTARLREPGDAARRRGEWPAVPVHGVLAGDPDRFRDLALHDPRFDRFGFARHDLPFEVRLSARGYAGATVEVVLSEDGRPVASRSLRLTSGSESVAVRLRARPERPGHKLYALEVRPQPGEAVQANNRIEMAVSVARDQTRVLLVCGRPSWDERFLRQLLKKDPNVDLVSFFILRDVQDQPGVPPDELSLIPFPVNELFSTELDKFDVIILQDFSRSAFLTNLHLENLRSWVVERGGGLLLVGGDLGLGAGGYAGSALEDVLPFALGGIGPDADETSFSPLVTAAGASHFVTGLEPDREATRALFAALPALDGTNRVGPLRPGALALLVHPRLAAGGAPMPVVAVRAVGRGRTMGVTFDTSWYWNFRAVGQGGSNRDYPRFWQNAVRWLSQDPSARYLSLGFSREAAEPGQPVEVRVAALRGDYSPLAGGRVRLDIAPAGSSAAPPVRSEGRTDASGRLVVTHVPAGEGFLRAVAQLGDAEGETIDRTEALLEVRADRTEIAAPAPDRERLESVARATGGRLLDRSELGSPPLGGAELWRLAERRRVELWDNGLVYGALLAALVAEWWLRRRVGLS